MGIWMALSILGMMTGSLVQQYSINKEKEKMIQNLKPYKSEYEPEPEPVEEEEFQAYTPKYEPEDIDKRFHRWN
jgi:hypothetical protein